MSARLGKSLLRAAGAALLLGAGSLPSGLPSAGVARAADTWRGEFDAICAKTQDAMALSADELRSLVARSDKLLPELERLGPTERKVFVKRLQACRSLYQFVLDTREKG